MSNRARHPMAVALYLLVFVWIVNPLIPDDTGLRFGFGYQVFLSVMVVAAALFFMLLEREHVPVPTSSGGVWFSIIVVCLATVGLLVFSGTVYPYPQFAIPTPEVGEAAPAKPLAEQGKDLFFASIGGISCAQCHLLEGKGGTRGPAMDDFAARAQQAIDEGRYPNVSLEEYTRRHILEGSAYFQSDPKYPPIMPPLGKILSEDQVEAMVAFLLTTGGSGVHAPAAGATPAEAKPEATPTEAESEATPAEATPASDTEAEEEAEEEGGEAAVDVAAALKVIEKTGCFACHLIPGAPEPPTPVGPDLSAIGARKDAEYIRRAILDPGADIAEECPTGPCPSPSIMPPAGSLLSEEEVELLVAYMMTLTGK